MKAKMRGIAIPGDLETQLTAVFNKSQMIMKHSRAWMTAGKIRSDTVSQQTQDYRNIIEGLQVHFRLLNYIIDKNLELQLSLNIS